MTLLPHLAARLFGAPLLIARPKLEVILAVLGPRIGLPGTDAAVPVHIPTEAPMPERAPRHRRDPHPRHPGAPHPGPGGGLGPHQLPEPSPAQLDAALANPRGPGHPARCRFPGRGDRRGVRSGRPHSRRDPGEAGLGGGQRHGLLRRLCPGQCRQPGLPLPHRRGRLHRRHRPARRPVGQGRTGRGALHHRLRRGAQERPEPPRAPVG